jgi:hypothetical protein
MITFPNTRWRRRLSSRCAAELTERWKTLSCNHEVSIILFGRNYITGAPAPCTPDDFSPELRPSLMQVWPGLVWSAVWHDRGPPGSRAGQC